MKKNRMAFFLVSLAVSLLASPVLAHHGFAGRYDEEHPITVVGSVVETTRRTVPMPTAVMALPVPFFSVVAD